MPKLTFANGRAFDAAVAALAAVSAGFVAFAMPDPLFAGLVEGSRLPEIVAAARPPLGDTARLAATAAAAVAVFALVWGLMAALGRRPARRGVPVDPVIQVPRQRRADAHPDAPPRPPLLARDLGEPLELDEVAAEPVDDDVPFETVDPRPLPAFLVPQDEAPEPVAEVEATEPQPEAEPVPIAELVARLPETDADADADAEEEGADSLSQLVNRIEFGLSRKRQALPAVELPAVEPPSADQEHVGHRLRSAINDLQKIASSGA